MIVHRLPYIIYRSYSDFGYLTDNRNYGYDTASHSCLKVGDLLLSKVANIFYSILSFSPQDIETIVSKLCKFYPEASPSVIRQDAIDFYTDLQRKGFLAIESDEDKIVKSRKKYFSYENWQPFELNLEQEQVSSLTYTETLGRTCQLTHIHIDISGNCNENCIHCYIPGGYKHGIMSKELFENILLQCVDMNVINIAISGGEPMFNPHLKYFLQLCQKYNISVNLLSNLTLLSDELLDIFEDNPLLCVQTSLYATEGEVHDSITQSKGSCLKTLSSIKRLYERNIPMQINCPIMKQNLFYYKDVLRFAKSMNIEADADYSLFGCYDYSKSNIACRLSIDEIEKVVHDDTGSDTKRKDSENKRKDSRTPICPVCKTSLCISNSGNIYPCEGWQSFSLGNVRNQSIRKIWEESSKVKYLRELTYGNFLKCNSCHNKNFCSPCLIMNANEDPAGDFFNINPFICEIARIKKDVYCLC
jgi:radical SAM protein with 4Fe4S-binding SPASM domain